MPVTHGKDNRVSIGSKACAAPTKTSGFHVYYDMDKRAPHLDTIINAHANLGIISSENNIEKNGIHVKHHQIGIKGSTGDTNQATRCSSFLFSWLLHSKF